VAQRVVRQADGQRADVTGLLWWLWKFGCQDGMVFEGRGMYDRKRGYLG